jgi:hypothetical protein
MEFERYTLPFTEAGLRDAIRTTLVLRANGFKTVTRERKIAGFTVVTVFAKPPKRATRVCDLYNESRAKR